MGLNSLTQEALADRSGLSQQYISGLENGLRNPTIVALYELSQALGVSHLALVTPSWTKPYGQIGGWLRFFDHFADPKMVKTAFMKLLALTVS